MKRRNFLLMALGMLCSITGLCWADTRADLKTGQSLLAAAKYDEAIALFSAVVASGDPVFAPKGQLGIGVALQGKKRYGESIDALRLGIRTYPNADVVRREMLFRLGEVYSLAGRTEDAVEVYRSIPVQYPVDAAKADFRLARLYLEQRKPSEATDLLKASIAAHPDAGDALDELNSLLGQCYRESGDLESAAAIYRAVIERDPETADRAYLALGICLQGQGKLPEARDAFEKVVAIGKDTSEARLRIDEVLRAEKDYVGELSYLRQLYEDLPELRAVSLTRQAEVMSECLGGVSEAKAAIGMLQRVISEYPDDPLAVEAEARVCAIQVHNLREFGVAEAGLRDFMAKHPDYPALIVTAHDLACCSYLQKDYAAAAALFVDAAKQREVGNYAAVCIFMAAESYMRSGDFQRAKAQVDLLISKYPDESWAEVAKTDYAQLTGEGMPGGTK